VATAYSESPFESARRSPLKDPPFHSLTSSTAPR
jgi:hypothetical protein